MLIVYKKFGVLLYINIDLKVHRGTVPLCCF